MFTHTIPGPAPDEVEVVEGAVAGFVVDEVRDVVAAGEAPGVGEGLLNQDFFAGVGEVAAGDGEVAGVTAALAGSFFLEWLRLVTLGEGCGLAVGVGDTASNDAKENPASVIVRAIDFFINRNRSEGEAIGARQKIPPVLRNYRKTVT